MSADKFSLLKVIVAQNGAREHYAVPRALHQQGMLAGLVTDWYATPLFRRMGGLMGGLIGGRGRSAFAARADGIPDELVHAFSFRSLRWKWQVRRLAAQGRVYEAYAQTDAAFANAVARCHLPLHDVFFGYSYASLEMLEVEKRRGVLTVLGQIDPGAAEFRLVAEEMARFPELAGPPPEFPGAYYDRNRREWELADVIVANSDWTREAIIAEGADPTKIEILPLAYEVNAGNRKSNDTSPRPSPQRGKGGLPSSIIHHPSSPSGTLRVLWLGQVNVRKGIHYLMQAARLLESEKVRFDVVGPIGILPEAVASAPRNMTFHGPVNRDSAAEWYRQSDVFVLPTLSDGFALTQLEAMAYGLPVITTPCCGDVVSHGSDGFIVPPRNPEALANAFKGYLAEPELFRSHQKAAYEKSEQFTLERLATLLHRLEASLFNR